MTVSILLFLPVLAALLVLLVKNEAAKHAALFFAVIELGLAGYFLAGFVPDASVQYGLDLPWIPQMGVYFKVGIDGISMVMVLLTTVLVPLIILTTYKHEYKNAKAFYALILFMQAGLLTVFTALDGFLFYVGWEAALIPIYFICALWGGENRIRINIKFFIYTFAGSLFMLLGIIYLYLQTPNKLYDINGFYNLSLTLTQQSWVFWAFFIAFAIKMPLFPFHTWQPDTYTEAPSAGTMMLSGIMLKMGIYGVIRWLIPNAPAGFLQWQNLVMILSVIGVVYASLIAFKQIDGKRLVAYSSIAHVGLIAAGIFAWTTQGVQGAMIQMLSHGINVVGMFFIWDIISRRLNTRDISQMGGIAKVAPNFSIAFLIILLGTVALPLTNGFVGEFLLLKGVFNYNIWFAAIAGLTIIFGAVYMLRMYKNVMQGEANELTLTFTDIAGSEKLVLGIICVLIIAIGVYPQPILHISEAAVTNLVNTVSAKFNNGGF
ncbi:MULTISPECIES: NADH-quinone oxidoreductase subunit M [unclassified Mucilaginibacter]|uniref:complex I subunit 4 family protein n=1 Tax=unclassified Mucilaginibacter TaxID=2617802 RepID=UPI002AC953F8|nr:MULTISPECIES: NADH-quinone oxidoreductase subunit M [unclassified Mucilaginibacter]MEB0262152.1 NADH-quinone oxidoreductase subunit M [Mucilaginibacter sp. 10I4]MEB0279813.1 NADH-quinone oxidoreductase subunit M [Mucilaginibacter sp. 10B2]MEB0301235.1 NADH-quinone oxidoreductase subunit M [Mucilaginibacter sp. 5C4]WPX24215.1 NADH-quinone oxidoreductase subunit M [Mucilaginibacter sp. 5C4]